MSDNYKTAWEKIRDYIEGLPEMLKLMPAPKVLIDHMAAVGPEKAMEIVHLGTYRQILGLMKEQEAMLGLEVNPNTPGQQALEILRKLEKGQDILTQQDIKNEIERQTSNTPNDNLVPFPAKQPNNTLHSVEQAEEELLHATRIAGMLNYEHMVSMHSDRAMCVLPTKETGLPIIACLWVTGQAELDRLMEYASKGCRLARDSREPYNDDDGSVGEN